MQHRRKNYIPIVKRQIKDLLKLRSQLNVKLKRKPTRKQGRQKILQELTWSKHSAFEEDQLLLLRTNGEPVLLLQVYLLEATSMPSNMMLTMPPQPQLTLNLRNSSIDLLANLAERILESVSRSMEVHLAIVLPQQMAKECVVVLHNHRLIRYQPIGKVALVLSCRGSKIHWFVTITMDQNQKKLLSIGSQRPQTSHLDVCLLPKQFSLANSNACQLQQSPRLFL